MDFVVPQSENQGKRKERQILRSCQRTEKVVEHKDDGNTNCNYVGTFLKGLKRGPEELEIGGRAEIIQTTAFLRSNKILRKVLETRIKLAVT